MCIRDRNSLDRAKKKYQFNAIAQNGFADCPHFDYIYIPDMIEIIGENAFTPCSATGVNMPRQLRHIGLFAFSTSNGAGDRCATPVKKRLDFPCKYSRGADGRLMPCVLQTVGAFAFKNFDVDSVVLPDSVEEIGPNAFDGASLLSFHMPKNLTSLGDQAFHNARNLHTVEGFDDIVATSSFHMGTNVFQDCTNLQTISFPGVLTVLPDFTFQNCNALERVDGSTETGPDRGPGVVSEVPCSLSLASLFSSPPLFSSLSHDVNHQLHPPRAPRYSCSTCRRR